MKFIQFGVGGHPQLSHNTVKHKNTSQTRDGEGSKGDAKRDCEKLHRQRRELLTPPDGLTSCMHLIFLKKSFCAVDPSLCSFPQRCLSQEVLLGACAVQGLPNTATATPSLSGFHITPHTGSKKHGLNSTRAGSCTALGHREHEKLYQEKSKFGLILSSRSSF